MFIQPHAHEEGLKLPLQSKPSSMSSKRDREGSDNMSDHMSNNMSDNMSDHMSDHMSDQMPEIFLFHSQTALCLVLLYLLLIKEML